MLDNVFDMFRGAPEVVTVKPCIPIGAVEAFLSGNVGIIGHKLLVFEAIRI